jgi:hypothetical protein
LWADDRVRRGVHADPELRDEIMVGAGWYGGVRIWNRWIAFERDRGRK